MIDLTICTIICYKGDGRSIESVGRMTQAYKTEFGDYSYNGNWYPKEQWRLATYLEKDQFDMGYHRLRIMIL